MLSPASIFGGRHRIIPSLIDGEMKQVYLAEDTRPVNRPGALAEMIDGFSGPELAREGGTLAGRDHAYR